MTSNGRRDSDPFADFRPGGTSVRPDDRLEVAGHYDVTVRPPAAAVRRAPEQTVQHQAMPPALQQMPSPVPLVSHPPQNPTAVTGAAQPKTRREAREAEALQAREAEARRTGQQQAQVVHPRRPESPPQGPDRPAPDDTQPQQVQRVEVQRVEVQQVEAQHYEPTARDSGTDEAGIAVLDHARHDEHLTHHEQHDQEAVGYYHDDGVYDGDHHDHPDGYRDGYVEDGRTEHGAMGPVGRRGTRGLRRLLILVAVLAVVGLGTYAAWSGLQPAIANLRAQFAPAEDYPGPGSTELVAISIDEGDNGKAIGEKLMAAGVVASVGAFVDAAKANPDWTSVQVGDYRIAQQLPAADAVVALLDLDNKVVNRVTVNAGWRTDQVLQGVADATGTPYDQVVATALALPLPEGAALPTDVDRAPTAIGDWEGWFLPYTYDLGLEPTPESVLTMMRDRTVTVLDGLGVAPADRRDVLNRASLVQAEGRPADYGMVAQVIENRLVNGVPLANGSAGPSLLQFDSTTNYATGTFNPQTTSEQRKTSHPFNTYAVEGLPPGPINSPSTEAIQAVISPTPGPWLFFVTVNLCTSETRFAATLSEHEANVEAYQDWLQANPKGPDGKYPCG